MDLFTLASRLTLNASEFNDGIDDATRRGRTFADSFSQITSGAAFKFNQITGVISTVANVAKTVYDSTIKVGLAFNSEIEDYTANFKVMLGSYQEAQTMVGSLKDMAADTPFDLSSLADATQTLLAFQVPAGKTEKVLQMLGDVALGDKNKLSSLALVFGQVSSAGRLTGQDLLQFINQGFNPLNYIAQRTGESMEALRDRMSKGRVTVEEVTQAFEDATSEGGQFYKGMETASKTTSGMLSTLQDDARALVGRIVQPFSELAKSSWIPAAQKAVEIISDALGTLESNSEEAKLSLFGTGEEHEGAQAESAQSWMERLMAVWSDGEIEDASVVAGFVESYKQNTATITQAYESRKEELAALGVDTADLESRISALAGYEAKIGEILENAAGRALTPEEVDTISGYVSELTELEGLVTTGFETNNAETKLDAIGNAIINVANAIAGLIEKWDSFKTILSNGGGLIAFAFMGSAGGPFAVLAGVLALVKTNWTDLVNAIEDTFDLELPPWVHDLAEFMDDAAWGMGRMFGFIGNLTTEGWDSAVQKWNESGEAHMKDKYGAGFVGGGVGRKDVQEEAAQSAQNLSESASDAADGVTDMGGEVSTTTGDLRRLQIALAGATGAADQLAATMRSAEAPTSSPDGMAEGGIFTRPTLLARGKYMVGEGSQDEAVLPLNTLWKEMGARLDAAMQTSGFAGGMDYEKMAAAVAVAVRGVNIDLELDKEKVARKSADANGREITRRINRLAYGMGGR